MKRKGTVVQVTGPVVDVAFDGGSLPEINEALSVAPDGQPRMMEVAQHIGGDTVRCIMLSPSEGIGRGDEVLSTGHTIEAPVGEATLGRMFNVLGQPIDEKGDVNAPEKLVHPPCAAGFCTAEARRPRFSRPASRSSTCSRRMPRAARSVCSAVPVSARPC